MDWTWFMERRGRAGLAAVVALVVATTTSDFVPIRAQASGQIDIGKRVKVTYPTTWSVAAQRLVGLTELVNVPVDRQSVEEPTAKIKIRLEDRPGHAETLQALIDMALGFGVREADLTLIGGWPALQYTRMEDRPQPGEEGPQFADEQVLRITTAIAANNVLVRLDAALPSRSRPELIAEVQTIGRNLVFSATGDAKRSQEALNAIKPRLRTAAPVVVPHGPEDKSPAKPATDGEERANLSGPGFNVRVRAANLGELEIAASNNGRNIVMGTNGGFHFSTDGGATWNPSAGIGSNDPSIGFAVSGAFYAANIRGGCQPADAAGPFGYTCTGISRSVNNGANFAIVGNAVACPNADPAGVVVVPNRCFPDQEHIAVDRFNAAPGGDQIYSTWRNFDATDQDPAIVCSQNGGATWTAPVDVGSGAFPRIGIGQDGFVYVVWFDGANFLIRRYSSCANGLVPQYAPQPITPQTSVGCPFPGHDRCDQNPTSQTIAVDDTNPNHLYFAYGVNTGAGNDDVRVRDSLDAGQTWNAGRVVRANAAVASPRIMPWLCTTGGNAYVTWYDRRRAAACPAPPCPGVNNDSTDMFAAKVGLDFAANLTAFGDFRITQSADPWCGTGAAANWPCSTRGAPGASESCSVQPQLAGRCCDNTQPNCPGSQQACDFSDGGCPAGETCNGGGGCPKYGDYNGNTCVAGRLLAGWASATSPPGTNPPSTSIGVFFDARIVGDVPQIQIPGNLAIDDTCVGSVGIGTLNVCNTGLANLEVGSIASSSPRFAVTSPSSGFPVIISPDFCFPFQVRFTPVTPGPASATLTVNSNDPSFPSATVQVSSVGLVPNIATLIANSGSFGDVCVDSFRDRDLTISNSGGCTLTVTNITSSSGQFQVPSTLFFPLSIGPGDSLAVPIRFAPTSLGAKSATITITSDDPDSPIKNVQVSGNVPPGDIRVTGSTSFGDVCPGIIAEKTVRVCNVGACDLHVTSAAFVPACPDFTLVNNPFPATVSHDSCLDLVIRFTPTSLGPKSCTLVITSDDPDTPAVSLTVTGNTPAPSIDVPDDLGFPPTVLQSVGACVTPEPFPVSNTGTCLLTITNFRVSTNPVEYSLSGLPSFPILLEPGHEAGEGDLEVQFRPATLDRDLTGTLSVTYLSDPITGATTTVERAVCGEGVRTGARVLVKAGGIPLPSVERIQLQRINANRNRRILDTNDVSRNLPLQTETPDPPCAPFQFHQEYGTVGNPIQLLPGSYQVTVTAIVNGRRARKTVGFDVNTCTFNPNIVVDF